MFALFSLPYSIPSIRKSAGFTKCKDLAPKALSVKWVLCEAEGLSPSKRIRCSHPSAPGGSRLTKRAIPCPLFVISYKRQPVVTQPRPKYRPSAWRYLWHVLISGPAPPAAPCPELLSWSRVAFRFQPPDLQGSLSVVQDQPIMCSILRT